MTLDIDVDKESFCQLLSKHQSGGNRPNPNKIATASCTLGKVLLSIYLAEKTTNKNQILRHIDR